MWEVLFRWLVAGAGLAAWAVGRGSWVLLGPFAHTVGAFALPLGIWRRCRRILDGVGGAGLENYGRVVGLLERRIGWWVYIGLASVWVGGSDPVGALWLGLGRCRGYLSIAVGSVPGLIVWCIDQ